MPPGWYRNCLGLDLDLLEIRRRQGDRHAQTRVNLIVDASQHVPLGACRAGAGTAPCCCKRVVLLFCPPRAFGRIVVSILKMGLAPLEN